METLEQETVEDEQITVFGKLEMLLDVLRIVSVIAAMVFIVVGAVLAYDFFYFVKEIVTQPEAIIRTWQDTVIVAHGAPPAVDSETIEPANAPLTTVVTSEPVSEASEISPETPENDPFAGAAPPETISESTPRPVAVRPDHHPWLTFGERVLEHLETGDLGWIAGLALLVAFCWVMGKIPAIMLSTGTKVLVDLFKIGKG